MTDFCLPLSKFEKKKKEIVWGQRAPFWMNGWDGMFMQLACDRTEKNRMWRIINEWMNGEKRPDPQTINACKYSKIVKVQINKKKFFRLPKKAAPGFVCHSKAKVQILLSSRIYCFRHFNDGNKKNWDMEHSLLWKKIRSYSPDFSCFLCATKWFDSFWLSLPLPPSSNRIVVMGFSCCCCWS